MGKLVLAGARISDGESAPSAKTLVVEDGLIAEIRPGAAKDGWAPDSRVIDLAGHVLVPGLVDAHTHLLMTGDMGGYEKELLKDGVPLRTLRAAAHARMAIDDGVLT